MSGMSINIDGNKINKSNFYKNKKIFKIYDFDVNKILVSYGKKIHLNTLFDTIMIMSLDLYVYSFFK